MLTNVMRRKVTVQKRTVTTGALGDTETWANAGSYWTRRSSVDVVTRQAYMSNNTIVTDRFLLNGEIDLRIATHRLIYAGYIYQLVESARHVEGQTTVLTKKGAAYGS